MDYIVIKRRYISTAWDLVEAYANLYLRNPQAIRQLEKECGK